MQEYKIEATLKGSKRQKTEFSCDIYKKIYAFRQGVMRHISNVHERRKLFRCDSCDYTFGAKQSHLALSRA